MPRPSRCFPCCTDTLARLAAKRAVHDANTSAVHLHLRQCCDPYCLRIMTAPEAKLHWHCCTPLAYSYSESTWYRENVCQEHTSDMLLRCSAQSSDGGGPTPGRASTEVRRSPGTVFVLKGHVVPQRPCQSAWPEKDNRISWTGRGNG